MKIFITGICGFVGSTLARELRATDSTIEVFGCDNFIRPGSELNRSQLKEMGIQVRHADIRNPFDMEAMPPADYVIDAAANPSVLAGVDGQTSSRQLLEHNLGGTINILEYCKAHKAGFVLLSTSRIYAIEPLAQLAMKVKGDAFLPDMEKPLPLGISDKGVSETFSTQPPLSLYGSSKLASEILALEYGATFGFPVWINRCGVLAGAGQFGRADQGIFSFWVNSFLQRKPLKYIGFGGNGYQVRDCLHPADLVPLLLKQFHTLPDANRPQIINLGGGTERALSLAKLSAWCRARFGPHEITSDTAPRPYDIPWLVMDSTLASETWNWTPRIALEDILTEIADHAREHPDWLTLSTP